MSSERILFEPHPKQQEFLDAVFSGKYDFLIYGGAMGGGKSYVCITTIIILCKFYPGSKWVIVRESLPSLKSTSIETFNKLKPTNFIASENLTDHIITFKNGSRIMFMAEDFIRDKEFNRFKGLEVNGFLLEQIEELHESLLDVCFVRAGRWKIPQLKKQPPPLIIGNVNPTLQWPKERIYDKWLKKSLPKTWFYLPALIYDNPVLANDESYMSRLSNMDSVTRQRDIEGDWTAFVVKNAYLYKYETEKHVIPEYKPNPHLPILISFDFNKEPMTCGLSQKPDVRTCVRFDEIYMDSGSTPELCDRIIAKYPQFMNRMDVTGDSTGHNRSPLIVGNVNHYTIIKQKLQLTDRNLLVSKKNMDLDSSRILCNSVLQNAKIDITSNCVNTIRDMRAEVDDKGDLVKNQAQPNHWLDNWRYEIEACFPDFITKPHKYLV